MALDCGMKPKEFWEYSVAEIRDCIKSYERVKKQSTKELISFGYMVSGLIMEHYAASRNEKSKVTLPWERYPELFREEKEIYRQEKAAADLEEYKKKRRAFAERVNQRMKTQETSE